VLESNREQLQEGRPPAGDSKAPGKGSVEQVYREQLETIKRLAAHACRRYGFSREEVEDFTQHVLLKIWADGCALLCKYQGRSSLQTFLASAISNALKDYVNSLWGKWRPSAAANRLGQLAIDLETLLVRDRKSFDEACQTLRSRGVTATDAELSELAIRLPPRSPRRLDGSYDGEAGAGGGDHRRPAATGGREPVAPESADERIQLGERRRRWQQIMRALEVALRALPAEDRLIAKLLGEFPVVAVAARLGLDQKALYRRKDKILRKLREALESAGFSAGDVGEILDHEDD
jgi:RNA polymerase sigma factor (sigma-70 family)